MLLTILLISQFYCDDYDDGNIGKCSNENAKKTSDCEKLDPGEYHKCCFYKLKIEGEDVDSYCMAVTKQMYEKIKDTIKDMEKDEDYEDVSVKISIDCGSNYIIISVLSLILLFL